MVLFASCTAPPWLQQYNLASVFTKVRRVNIHCFYCNSVRHTSLMPSSVPVHAVINPNPNSKSRSASKSNSSQLKPN